MVLNVVLNLVENIISLKKLLLKIWQYPQEKPEVGSLFEKVAGRQTCSFIKKRTQHMRFHVNVAKCLRLSILKNICHDSFLTVSKVQSLYCMTESGVSVRVTDLVLF